MAEKLEKIVNKKELKRRAITESKLTTLITPLSIVSDFVFPYIAANVDKFHPDIKPFEAFIGVAACYGMVVLTNLAALMEWNDFYKSLKNYNKA